MTIEIKWTDTHPRTGQRRFICAEKWAGEWTFKWKLQRRGEWTRGMTPSLAMWEIVLDSLKRRYQRREGVTDEDVAEVERTIAALRRRQAEWDARAAEEPPAVPASESGEDGTNEPAR
jgi:hypothetical protein